MGDATRDYFVDTLRHATSVLDGAGIEHLVIGGLATTAALGARWSTDEDIDLFLRKLDAKRAMHCLAEHGYSTCVRDPTWIYKAARPNVTIDLIFRAGERIELDREHIARSAETDLDGVTVHVPCVEDLILLKATHDAVDRPHPWHQCVRLLAQRSIDWSYLSRRGAALFPDRTLALLLYARSAGIAVPDGAVGRLIDRVRHHATALRDTSTGMS